MSTLFTESTKVPARRSAQEVMDLLAAAGATTIITEYAPAPPGEVSALHFEFTTHGALLAFRLPVRVDAIERLLRQGRGARPDPTLPRNAAAQKLRDQAARVAWRQAYWWIKAQLAYIQSGQVTREEVFLPYLQMRDGRTVYETLAARNFMALPAPASGGGGT